MRLLCFIFLFYFLLECCSEEQNDLGSRIFELSEYSLELLKSFSGYLLFIKFNYITPKMIRIERFKHYSIYINISFVE